MFSTKERMKLYYRLLILIISVLFYLIGCLNFLRKITILLKINKKTIPKSISIEIIITAAPKEIVFYLIRQFIIGKGS